MLFIELALRVRMRKESDKHLGGVNFVMASRKLYGNEYSDR